MKTPLQIALAALAPSISIRTIWEHDPDPSFSELSGPGLAFENEDPDEWSPWQSEVRATAIVNGDEITGSAYMGGTWEKAGNDPATSNPTISGYENQMTQEALEELMGQIPAGSGYLKEFTAALAYLDEAARREYEAQRAAVEAPR